LSASHHSEIFTNGKLGTRTQPRPPGVKAVHDEPMAEQLVTATGKCGAGDLAAPLHSGETWTIS
jgi:hypothetical protein